MAGILARALAPPWNFANSIHPTAKVATVIPSEAGRRFFLPRSLLRTRRPAQSRNLSAPSACPLWRAGRFGWQLFSALALAGQRNASSAETRPAFAGGESVERAEAFREFRGVQPPLAVEPTEKTRCVLLALARIARQAARDKVAVRVAPAPGLRNDMVQAFHHRRDPPHAIEAPARFTGVDGLA